MIKNSKMDWRMYVIIILAALVTILAVKSINTYRKRIVYTTDQHIQHPGSNIVSLISLSYSTRRAFLPGQHIRVMIRFGTMNDSIIKQLNNARDFYVLFSGSISSSSGVNKKNA